MSLTKLKPKLHIDLAWMQRLSSAHSLFKKNRDGEWCCRCNICGDSQKNKTRTRFYFLVKAQSLMVYCHNCGYSHTFYTYVKDQFPEYFDEYKKETLFGHFKESEYKDTSINEESILTEINETKRPELEPKDYQLCKISDLTQNHPARKYLTGRKLDFKFNELLYTDNFKYVVNQINPERALKLADNEPRIVIPFLDQNGKLFGAQGRSLSHKSSLRYITIMKEGCMDKVYGMNTMDVSKDIYVVEGPFDSMFIDNACATCDASLTKIERSIPNGNFVYVWDNQSRNKNVVKYMDRAINEGKRLVIWPSDGSLKQDINDLIINGMSKDKINQILLDNTYSGLTLKMKFSQWKNV